MPRFIAIPVTQGDAFYLERDDCSVLVDGGRSRLGFPITTFQKLTKAHGVDIVVCTHNDADHANGILGFLEAGLTCREVWLPGRWLSTLPDVLKPFAEVFDELANDVAHWEATSNRKEWPAELSPLEVEEMRERFSEPSESNDWPFIGEDGWPESYVQLLEQAEPWEIFHGVPWWICKGCRFPPYCLCLSLRAAGMQLLWSAIDAASRIRAIAIEAFHRGIPVRWFEFDPAHPRGGIKALQPLNARAIARVRPRVEPLLYAVALTVSNKESLVFWSPPTKRHPGVLFTADSDLSGVQLPQLARAIVTAPHHGSVQTRKPMPALTNFLRSRGCVAMAGTRLARAVPTLGFHHGVSVHSAGLVSPILLLGSKQCISFPKAVCGHPTGRLWDVPVNRR